MTRYDTCNSAMLTFRLLYRDPTKSLPFYTNHLGFTLIDKFDFPQYKFCIYFLTTMPDGEKYNFTPGSQEAHDYQWRMESISLELMHDYKTERKLIFNFLNESFWQFWCAKCQQEFRQPGKWEVLSKPKPVDEGRMIKIVKRGFFLKCRRSYSLLLNVCEKEENYVDVRCKQHIVYR